MFNKLNKKGVSVVVEYVLLISVSIVMSLLVYNWIKTYVPKDSVKCDEGTSLFIKDYIYQCGGDTLTLTLKNNGKFSIHGFYIRASNKSGEELASIDISSRLLSGGGISGNSVVFSRFEENSLSPEELYNTKTVSFNITGLGQLYKIEIIPLRIQIVEEKKKIATCGDASIKETLTCREEQQIGSLGEETNPASSCSDLFENGTITSGVYWINYLGKKMQVYCNMSIPSALGGWTLFEDFISSLDNGASPYGGHSLTGILIDSFADLNNAGWNYYLTTLESSSYTKKSGYLQMFYSGSPIGYINKTLPTGFDEVYVTWGNWYSGTASLSIGGVTVKTLSSNSGASTYKGTYSPGNVIKFSENGIVWVGEIWVK